MTNWNPGMPDGSAGGETARRIGPKRDARRLSLATVVCAVLAVAVAILGIQILHGRVVAPGLADSSGANTTAKYVVLIVLDGATPGYLNLAHLPNLDRLTANGTRFTNAFDGILESETPSGHTTIATGSTPARNGILGFEWNQNDQDYSIFSPKLVNSGAMEHIMESARVPTIAGLYKAKNPHSTVVALSGHKYYAADPMGGPDADAIMYYQGDPRGRYVPVAIPGHVPPTGVLNAPGVIYPTTHLQPGVEDSLATRLALATVDKMRPNVLMINYPEFDWPLGHVKGGPSDPTAVITLMKNFDRDLGLLEARYQKYGILDQTLFVITADHGMAPTNRFIPQSVVTNAVSRAGTSIPADSFSTGAYVWLKDASRASDVARNIAAAKDPGVQSVYYLTTANGKPAYALGGGTFVNDQVDAANRYLLATLINGHQPNVVAFAKQGQTFSSPSTNWKADHGGNTWQAQHIPLIFSGPGIQRGTTVTDAAQLEDVAPTLLADLGVRPTGMEGHILTDALTDPASADVSARNTEISQVAPYAKALIAQNAFESSAG